MTASNIVFSVFSAIGLVLSLIPLWWHLESWNVGTCMFMIWTALACLVYFVDSVVWSGNTINWAPVWCDIAVRIQVGIAVAWPACALCIIRRLHIVTSSSAISASQTDKRREVVTDLLITVGIPVLEMGLEYTVSSHRFTIVEDFGCFTATWNTPLTYVLVWSWPLIIGIVSACYGALTIRAFIKRRKQFRDLINTNTNLTYSRYWRLIAIASVDFCLTIPLGIKTVVTNILLCPHPWVPWAEAHSDHSRVIQVPRVQLDQVPATHTALEFTRWAAVLCAFVFFGFFGFADEAMKHYRLLASTVSKRLGYTTFTQSTTISDFTVKSGTGLVARGSLPVLITQETESKVDWFPDRLSTATILGDYEPGVLAYSHVGQRTSLGSSAMTSLNYEVPRAPEHVLDFASVHVPPYSYPYPRTSPLLLADSISVRSEAPASPSSGSRRSNPKLYFTKYSYV